MTIICRYGELWLKSEKVRRRWEQVLINSIRQHLERKKIKYVLGRVRGRIFIETPKEKAVLNALKKVFGFSSFSAATKTNLKDMKKVVLDAAKRTLKKKDTFAVRAKREGKHGFSSQDVERELGALIVAKLKNKVNLSNPKRTIFVEIRDNDVYVFTDKIKGAGGLPLGVEGKAISLLSGTKESLVASFLVMKRGCKIILLAKSKALRNIKILQEYDPKIEVFSDKENVMELAEKFNAKALVLEESLSKLSNIDNKVDLPVFRPIIALDKKQINKIAKQMA